MFFADIAGFTAWSSQREPTQVFTLLQTLYHAFDRVANKRDVFKVETIGDCYMAGEKLRLRAYPAHFYCHHFFHILLLLVYQFDSYSYWGSESTS